jgi:hypothetical protein
MQISPATPSLDRRTFWAGILAVTLVVLVVAHALRPSAFISDAQAAEVVDTRDFSLVTADQDDGNQAIYVLDKRTGLLAILLWDNNARQFRVADMKPVQGAFGG